MDSLARIREWVNAATPAPWKATDHGPMGVFVSAEPGRAPKAQRVALFDGLDDARFAAKARETLPTLLGTLDQQGVEMAKLRGERHDIEAERDDFQHQIGVLQDALKEAGRRNDLLLSGLREVRHLVTAIIRRDASAHHPEAVEIRDICRRLVGDGQNVPVGEPL
jgi:hypothetical protein